MTMIDRRVNQVHNHDSQIIPKPCVAILDDNEDARSVLRELLDSEYTIQDFGNVPDLLAFLYASDCDVIISDLSLPLLDGFDFIRILKHNPYLSTIPVIAWTADASYETRDRALSAGFVTLFVKPADLLTMKSAVAEHLKRNSGSLKKVSDCKNYAAVRTTPQR